MKEKYEKKIDWVFYNEQKIIRAVQEARIDNPRPEKVIGEPNKITDPTAQMAIRNMTLLSSVIVGQREIITKKKERRLVGGVRLEYPEHWLTVISRTYNWCKRQSEIHYQAVKRKYLGQHYLRICREIHISEKTLYNFIKRAKQYAALQAVQFRLIYID